ncbi:MAG TPA: right-handed parallel beta-helix repeat-containing protein, partial [Acidimicrobiia bacterium]|nr:right-handed parallel beta-helix repeat-containing protein [Acidimicrobiia bacterium]
MTAQLQRFIDAVPNGTIISFPGAARYRLGGTLRLVSRRAITLDGNGATLFATPSPLRERAQLELDESFDIVVQGFRIVGSNPNAGTGEDAYNPDYEAQHGINVLGGQRINIVRNEIRDVYGDFVYIGHGRPRRDDEPSAVTIRDNLMHANGRQGITVTHGFDIDIVDNSIYDVRRTTIDFEPNVPEDTVAGVQIRSNRIGAGRLLFVGAEGNGVVNDIAVVGNKLQGRTMSASFRAPYGTRRSGIVWVGNVSDKGSGNPDGATIGIHGYDHIHVSDNVQPSNIRRDMHMVAAYQLCDYE